MIDARALLLFLAVAISAASATVSFSAIKEDQIAPLSAFLRAVSSGRLDVTDAKNCPSNRRDPSDLNYDGGPYICDSDGNVVKIELSSPTERYFGTLSSEIGKLTSLTSLSIGYHYITGTIPTEIAECSALKTLALYGLQLRGQPADSLASLDLENCILQRTGTQQTNCFENCILVPRCHMSKACRTECPDGIGTPSALTPSPSPSPTPFPTTSSTSHHESPQTEQVAADEQFTSTKEATTMNTKPVLPFGENGTTESSAQSASSSSPVSLPEIDTDANNQEVDRASDDKEDSALWNSPLTVALVACTGTVISLVVICIVFVNANRAAKRDDPEYSGAMDWFTSTLSFSRGNKNKQSGAGSTADLSPSTESTLAGVPFVAPPIAIYGPSPLAGSGTSSYDCAGDSPPANIYDRVDQSIMEPDYDQISTPLDSLADSASGTLPRYDQVPSVPSGTSLTIESLRKSEYTRSSSTLGDF